MFASPLLLMACMKNLEHSSAVVCSLLSLCAGLKLVQVLVLKNYEAITRLRGIAQKNKFPVPSMLADSLIQVMSTLR